MKNFINTHKITHYTSNLRSYFKKSNTNIMFIDLDEIEGLSLPFIQFIVYCDTNLTEY